MGSGFSGGFGRSGGLPGVLKMMVSKGQRHDTFELVQCHNGLRGEPRWRILDNNDETAIIRASMDFHTLYGLHVYRDGIGMCRQGVDEATANVHATAMDACP